MKNRAYYIINGITLYRLVTAPLLLLLVVLNHPELFKWGLALSFCTDAIDGFLARHYKVKSSLGSRLDSIGDDLTIAAAIAGVLMFKRELILNELPIVLMLSILYVVQVSAALYRYRQLSIFHTYTAKTAAILQSIFLLLLFFLDQPVYSLFYITAAITALALIEEIILVVILPKPVQDVKGLWWVLREMR